MSRRAACLAAGTALVGAGIALALFFHWRKPSSPADDIPLPRHDDPVPGALTIHYPLDETLFPPEIVAPTFRWTDGNKDSDIWLVTIEFPDAEGDMNFRSGGTKWRPADERWEVIKRRSLERAATVTIRGVNRRDPKRILSGARISISTSADEVGAPIFYREVNLPFVDAVRDPSRIRWRFGPISSKQQPPVVLSDLPTCGNCHSFSADGKTLGMDVDSANDKGSYVIAAVQEEMAFDKDKVITWSDYKREDGESTFGLLAQISPSGRYAVSMVKDRHVTVGRPDLEISQLFFPVKGILAIYDRQKRTFNALPGADDRKLVHGCPAWSPDTKTIVFARAKARDLKGDPQRGFLLVASEVAAEFLHGGQTFPFDLYTIPFNDGKGGKAKPLAGASGNGMSNYFPKYSPDGKWIVFCRAKSFMLLQPDSELYIVPAEGGQARRMRCNTPRLNSWHSWSPNGRWLVFSSKVNGPYTQLFLTHVDEQGRDTPAVLLENFTFPEQKRAANIPEFVNAKPDAIKTIREEFLDDYCYYRAGTIALSGGDPEGALRQYRRALKLNPKYALVHFKMGVAHGAMRRYSEAISAYEKAIALKPGDADAHMNMGNMLLAKGMAKEAVASLAKAIELRPNFPDAHYNLGVAYHKMRRHDEAIAAWKKTIAYKSDHAKAYCNIGTVYVDTGRIPQAVEALKKAVAIKPDYVLGHRNLAEAYAQGGEFPKAVGHAERAYWLARAAGDHNFAGVIRQSIEVYRQGKCLRPK